MAHTITHEHTVKDEIFFMHKNKVTNGKIEAVQIFVNKSQFANSATKVQYTIAYKEDGTHSDTTITRLAEDVFATKQELLDSL